MRVTCTLSCPSGIASQGSGTRVIEDVEGRDVGRQTEVLEGFQQWIKDEMKRPDYLGGCYLYQDFLNSSQ